MERGSLLFATISSWNLFNGHVHKVYSLEHHLQVNTLNEDDYCHLQFFKNLRNEINIESSTEKKSQGTKSRTTPNCPLLRSGPGKCFRKPFPIPFEVWPLSYYISPKWNSSSHHKIPPRSSHTNLNSLLLWPRFIKKKPSGHLSQEIAYLTISSVVHIIYWSGTGPNGPILNIRLWS